jgi:hypothetical protein
MPGELIVRHGINFSICFVSRLMTGSGTLRNSPVTLRLDFPAIPTDDNHVIAAVTLEKAGPAEPCFCSLVMGSETP